MLKSLGILAVLIALTFPAAALECKSSRANDGKYWSWRQIDGKRCWYVGARGMAKAKLHWRAPVARKLPLKPRPPLRSPSERDEESVLLRSVWPPLPARPDETDGAEPFASRWQGDRRP